jgi:hypothetical protein
MQVKVQYQVLLKIELKWSLSLMDRMVCYGRIGEVSITSGTT